MGRKTYGKNWVLKNGIGRIELEKCKGEREGINGKENRREKRDRRTDGRHIIAEKKGRLGHRRIV